MNKEKAFIALGEGKKITHPLWENGFYKYLSKEGILRCYNPSRLKESFVSLYGLQHEDDYEIYKEPKAKNKYWLWVCKDTGRVSDFYYDEYGISLHDQSLGMNFTIKLEWSEIEL